jgi:alpha-1,2-glucosyltransferase
MKIKYTILFVITLLIYYKINKEVKESYMDEIFHIPQAQAYCKNQFSEWNNKITTFPGL